MKLYIHPLSVNVRRVRLAAALLGFEIEEEELDFTRNEHKAPTYLALNPNGAVPTLVDGDLVLTESRAIMQYLCWKRPETDLFPSDPRTRIDVIRWQFWDASQFGFEVGTVVWEKFFKPTLGVFGEPEPDKIERGLAAFRRFGAVLDKRLEGKQYIVGDSLTLADLSIAASLTYARKVELPLDDFPNLAAWFSRMTELDAWKKANP